MSHPLALPCRIRWGLLAGASTAMLAVLVVLAAAFSAPGFTKNPASSKATGVASTSLVRLADAHPAQRVEAIVQFENGVSPTSAHGSVRAEGGRVTAELPIINGLAARMTAGDALQLSHRHGVRVVSLNAGVKRNSSTVAGIDTSLIQTTASTPP